MVFPGHQVTASGGNTGLLTREAPPDGSPPSPTPLRPPIPAPIPTTAGPTRTCRWKWGCSGPSLSGRPVSISTTRPSAPPTATRIRPLPGSIWPLSRKWTLGSMNRWLPVNWPRWIPPPGGRLLVYQRPDRLDTLEKPGWEPLRCPPNPIAVPAPDEARGEDSRSAVSRCGTTTSIPFIPTAVTCG